MLNFPLLSQQCDTALSWVPNKGFTESINTNWHSNLLINCSLRVKEQGLLNILPNVLTSLTVSHVSLLPVVTDRICDFEAIPLILQY